MKTGAPTARKPGQGSRIGHGRLVRKEDPITRDRVVSDRDRAASILVRLVVRCVERAVTKLRPRH